jgi:hypothetical protein
MVLSIHESSSAEKAKDQPSTGRGRGGVGVEDVWAWRELTAAGGRAMHERREVLSYLVCLFGRCVNAAVVRASPAGSKSVSNMHQVSDLGGRGGRRGCGRRGTTRTTSEDRRGDGLRLAQRVPGCRYLTGTSPTAEDGQGMVESCCAQLKRSARQDWGLPFTSRDFARLIFLSSMWFRPAAGRPESSPRLLSQV